jgi:hypothetical protein
MKTQSALCASLIKKELKQKFPTIKFSVRSDNYSGGDSVHIGYVDAVPRELVEKEVKKYQYGHFDGMTDMYEYNSEKVDFPQSKYIFVERHVTEEARNKIIDQIKKYYGVEEWNDETAQRICHCWANDVVYRLTREATF